MLKTKYVFFRVTYFNWDYYCQKFCWIAARFVIYSFFVKKNTFPTIENNEDLCTNKNHVNIRAGPYLRFSRLWGEGSTTIILLFKAQFGDQSIWQCVAISWEGRGGNTLPQTFQRQQSMEQNSFSYFYSLVKNAFWSQKCMNVLPIRKYLEQFENRKRPLHSKNQTRIVVHFEIGK